MSQLEPQRPEPGSGSLHNSLISRQAASTQVIIQGGHQGKAIETLHSLLCEHLLKDSRQARTAKLAHFPKMSALLADKDGTFHITLGRGLPADSFRTSLIGWLEFLRSSRVIEVIPALEYRTGEIVCNDYVIIQEDKEQDLPLEALRNEALKSSIDAAGQWLGAFSWSQGVADDLLEKQDPAFIHQLPYFRMLEAVRSDWHAPKDTTHNAFAEQMRAKSDLLTKVYAALLASEKLRFQTKLPGVKKLGERFPFAWPGSAAALRDLVALHDRLRLIFVRDVLLSDKVPGVRANAGSQFAHSGISADAFQTAYQQYLKAAELTPAVPVAHKMGISFLQNFLPIFSQKESSLRAEPGALFARNVVVFMVMHCEPVIEYQKDSERVQFYEVVEHYIQKLAAAEPPFVDLNTFVRLDKNVVKNEMIRRRMIDALRAHSKVKHLEIKETVTFGQGRVIIFAYHTDHLEAVCNRSYLNARDHRDFNLHLNLERIYDCITDPSRLEPLLRPETYERFLQTRQDYYVSQMPFLKRLLWKLFGFARKIDPAAMRDFIKAAMHTETRKAAATRQEEARTEVRKEQERIARRALEGGGRESEPESLERALPDLDSAAVPASEQPGEQEPARRSSPVPEARPVQTARMERPAETPRTAPPAPAAQPAPTTDRAPRDTARTASAPAETQPETRPEPRQPAAPQRPPAFVEAPRPGQPAVKPAMAKYRIPERSEEGAVAESSAGEAARNAEQRPAEPPDAPREASRLSLQELTAKAEGPGIDPDHVQFLKQPGTKTTQASTPEPDWEQQVIIVGRKMGMDLTEERRLARKKEKELHKKERQALALKKMQEHKKKVARKQAVKPAPEQSGPATPKHLVIIEIPVKYCVSGKPVRIQFQKKYFKSESFRKEMAEFYRKESEAAPTAEDKRYFAYLISAVEKNYAQYLK